MTTVPSTAPVSSEEWLVLLALAFIVDLPPESGPAAMQNAGGMDAFRKR
jgi:hypothetical protein